MKGTLISRKRVLMGVVLAISVAIPNLGVAAESGPGRSATLRASAGATSPSTSSRALASVKANGAALAAGLVGAWGFDEGSGLSVGDASGSGNVGSVVGASWSTAGKFGGALVFNGSNARVNVPDSASLHLTGGMTLEAWVYPATTSNGWRDVVYKGNDNYYLEGSSLNGGRPAGGGTFGGANANVYAGSALAANTWSHLALTYDGAALRLYVNGTLVSTQAQTGSIAVSSNPLQIGGDTIWGQYFNGRIDEVRVYNTALSAASIQTDMNTPIGSGGGGDTTAPSTPGGLATGGVGETSVTLSWGASNDDVAVTGYRLYLDGSEVNTSPSTSYVFGGLSCGHSYMLGVAAFDAAGNQSATATIGAQTSVCSDTTPPSAPGTLTASAAGSGSIGLAWGAASDNVAVTGYQVFRCQGTGCSSFTQVATPTGTSYTDTGLSAGTGYSYRVRARDAAGNTGAYSNTATATTQSAPSGLVGAWGFDEGSGLSVGDASGSGNVGSVVGASWSTAGKFGGALVFNGSSARVNVPDSASLHLTGGMTVEAWVYPATTSNGWRDVIYKGNDNYYLEGSSLNGGRPAGGGTFGGANANVYAGSALAANTWSHLALTYDGAALRLYVNGTLVSTQAQTGSIAVSSNPLQIGGDTIWGQYFNGRIDEVRVYNTALSAASIQTDMNTPVGSGGGGDTTAPSTPGGLATGGVGETSVTLSWGASNDDVAVTGYRLYLDGSEVNTSPSTSYVFGGLSCGHSYMLGVAAFDAAGNQSATATIGAQTSVCSDTTPPSAPGTLTASAAGSGSIGLAWGAASDNVAVTGYQVFRCQGAGCSSFTQVATPTGTSYTDTGLSAGTGYSYRVRARDAAGNTGAYSNTATATTQSAPSGLVGAWGFDEGSGLSVGDASGSGNVGSVVGASWSTAGKFGGALVFNGSNARVNVPDSASLHLTGGMTLEAWVYPATTSNGWRDVIYKGNDNYYLEGSRSMVGGLRGVARLVVRTRTCMRGARWRRTRGRIWR